MSTHTHKYCPKCGNMYESYSTLTKHMYNHYGCPFLKCSQCGTVFVDKDIKEHAFFPKEKFVISNFNCIMTMFFPFGVLGVMFLVPLFYDKTAFDTYAGWVSLTCAIVSIGIYLCCVIFAFRNRKKAQRELDTAYSKSEQRLKDPNYVKMLRQAGVYFPEQIK
ncbi:MAG: hypothetical protein IKM04_02230 [Clostridia bacterium]|nr:hypothetical protein [Clostridia bacterium]